MHELSLAQNIVDTIQQCVPQSDWGKVTVIRLKIGACAGVVKDSLEFSYQAVAAETVFQSSRLEIESIPFKIQCGMCGSTTENEAGFTLCTACGSSDTKIISGTELQVTEVEIAESEANIP